MTIAVRVVAREVPDERDSVGLVHPVAALATMVIQSQYKVKYQFRSSPTHPPHGCFISAALRIVSFRVLPIARLDSLAGPYKLHSTSYVPDNIALFV